MKISSQKTISTILLATLGLSLAACSDESFSVSAPSDIDTLASLERYAIQISPATIEQCASGGQVFTVYFDDNNSASLDTEETVLSATPLCNGTNGTNGTNGANGVDGYSTLFSLDRVETDICEVNTGVQINSGLDLNRNTSLENSEIAQSQVLCDGRQGTTGDTGADGKRLVFQVTAASSDMCPTGGKIILMGSDENDSGTLDVGDTNQQSLTLCNGANGQNGEDGEDGVDGEDGADAVLPAYTPVAPIFPCGNTAAFKEVLLRLQSGQVLASFSDTAQGSMTRLTLIPDGRYMTTDNTSCIFNLSTAGSTRSISWSGQVQQSWPISY